MTVFKSGRIGFIAAGLWLLACSSTPTTNVGGGDSGTAESPSPGGDADGAAPDSDSGVLLAAAGLTSETVPPGSKVIVLWSVRSRTQSHAYNYGEGTAANKTFYVSFSAAPPPDALNTGALGIGFIALVPASSSVPEGKVTDAQPGNMSFISVNHAIVYRGSEAPNPYSRAWADAFPQGYSCGKCVRHDAGVDAFEVADCSSVTLVPIEAGVTVCNWE